MKRGFAILFLLLPPGIAQAVEGDTFRPLVTFAYGYDSNPYRLESDSAAVLYGIDSALHSDTHQRLGIGFDLDWKQGRQRVISKVQANTTRFERYRRLDYRGTDANLEWQWQLGNYWNGHLGLSQSQSLGSFRDSQGLGQVSNTRTDSGRRFEANYRIHPRWQASLRTSSSSNEYSASSQRGSNAEVDTAVLGGYYLGRAIERIGMEIRNVDGRFPDRILTPTLEVAYQERNFDLVANWVASGKSRLNARFGYLQRQNRNIVGRDFSGLEWRFDGSWVLTGKSALGGSLYREVGNVELATANHAVSLGGSLNYQWQVTSKTRVQASVSHESIDYDSTTRQDKIGTAALAATYEPWPGGELSAGIQHESRDSSAAFLNYDSNSLFVNANLKF